jgi:hypothetical protein
MMHQRKVTSPQVGLHYKGKMQSYLLLKYVLHKLPLRFGGLKLALPNMTASYCRTQQTLAAGVIA